ncbi:MAG TPA: hypothetical protein VFO86_05390 [Terriglobia bacterium]|nr:hypothetical protein [Terriglobia bacterium]
MILVAMLFLLMTPAQQNFTKFSYCRESASGDFEMLCIDLDSSGVGQARFKRRDDDDLKVAVALSPAGKNQFLSALSGTKYLEKASTYESKRKVADLGKKHLTLEMPSGRREAEFNYSDLKDVNALVTFFEGLITQEAIAIDLKWALQFDRLGIPERLDQLENVLKQGRITDPKSMVDVLAQIDHDENIVNYARVHARELSERITSGK